MQHEPAVVDTHTHEDSGIGIRGIKGFSSRDNTHCPFHWAPLQAATGSCCMHALLSRVCTFSLYILLGTDLMGAITIYNA